MKNTPHIKGRPKPGGSGSKPDADDSTDRSHPKDADDSTDRGHPKDADHSTNGKKYPLTKDDVPKSNDEHIDQDFPGFPHDPSKEKDIKTKKTN